MRNMQRRTASPSSSSPTSSTRCWTSPTGWRCCARASISATWPPRTPDQQSLTDMMVGHAVGLNIDRPEPVNVHAPSGGGRLDRAIDRAGRQAAGRCELHRQRRRDAGHGRHCRQRPAGAAGGHCRASTPSPTAACLLRSRRTASTEKSGGHGPHGHPQDAALPCPLSRRTGWAWVWSAPWA